MKLLMDKQVIATHPFRMSLGRQSTVEYRQDMPSAFKLSTLSSPSRRVQVAEAIRDAIIGGQLEPGQRLTELDLAAQLGTSRAPIREALRELEREGLVISYPYRGTEVLGVSQEEIENVLVPVRLSLERYAFVKASQQLGEDDVERLQGFIDEMERSARDAAALADADVRFHETVIELSHQPHCLQLWRTLQPRVRAYFRRDAVYYEDPRVVADQHRILVDALRAGDEHTIDAAVVAHIQTHFAEEEH